MGGKLTIVKFDHQYKNDDDEVLSIENYKDYDKTFSSFDDSCNGQNNEILRVVDDLSGCNAILSKVSKYPNITLIHRFSNYYLARRESWFGLADSDTVSNIDASAFTVPSNLTGYFDIGAQTLVFRNIQSIRGALPGFTEHYLPTASDSDIQSFLTNSVFEGESVRKFSNTPNSIRRLFWMLINSNLNLNKQLNAFQELDAALNLKCFESGKILMTNEARRMKIVLRILMGDVYLKDGIVYLVNSKRPIDPF